MSADAHTRLVARPSAKPAKETATLWATPLAHGKARIRSRRTAAGVQVGLVTARQQHRAF